mgnify:CR=1 FL=1
MRSTNGSIRLVTPSTAASAKTGSSWEFPLLGKHRFGRSLAKPYVEAGISFNHLSGYLLPSRSPDLLVGQPAPVSQQPEGPTTRTGFALGGRIEFKLAVVRISPGIRFSHWAISSSFRALIPRISSFP